MSKVNPICGNDGCMGWLGQVVIGGKKYYKCYSCGYMRERR